MRKFTAFALSFAIICALIAPVCLADDDYLQLYFGNETVMEVQPKTNEFLVLHPENGPNIDLSYTVSCDSSIGVIDKLEDGVVDQYMLRISDRKPDITGRIYAEKDGVKYAITVNLVYPKEGFYLTPDKNGESYIVRDSDGRYTFEYDANSRSIYFITSGATLDSVVTNSKDVMTTLSADKTVAVIAVKSSMKGDRSVVLSYTLNEGGKTSHNIQTIFFKERVQEEEKPPVEVIDEPEPDEKLLPHVDYSDVPEDAWMAEAVDYVSRRGLFNGYPDGSFGVDDNMSRAMTAVVLWRIAGRPDFQGTNAFTDVPENAWYLKEVTWAADVGYIKGVGDDLFAPETNITYQMLCTLLHRLSGSPEVKGEDISGVSDWAQSAMKWATENGIIDIGESGVKPQDAATRARVAEIIMNYKMLDNK